MNEGGNSSGYILRSIFHANNLTLDFIEVQLHLFSVCPSLHRQLATLNKAEVGFPSVFSTALCISRLKSLADLISIRSIMKLLDLICSRVMIVLFLTDASLSAIIPTVLKTLSATKFAATSFAYLSLSLPFGNIGTAFQAIVKDPEAITCSLDTMLTDDYHGSCQQLDSVVRLRAGKLLTIKQVDGVL
jgi:hypothetical protein